VKPRTTYLTALALTLSACGGAIGGDDTSSSTTIATAPIGAEPAVGEPLELPDHLAAVTSAWETDFTKTTIDLNELLVGIGALDPRDLIRPIDDPRFQPVAESDWIEDPEPGVLVDINEDVRFYPLSILTRHEIINDEIGGIPVAVTYCPLCNTALAFDRRVEGDVLRLGVSGLLRNSDLVMWDDVTQSLWQQVTGEAIVGEFAGKNLTPVASAIVRWADFRQTHPDGVALGPDQGFGRGYGTNPYEFYSSRERPYAFFRGEIDDRFPALERVVGVTIGEIDKAYPFSLISQVRVVNDQIEGQPLVVFWGASDTADALDRAVIANGEGIGTGVAYSSIVDGQPLTFEPLNDTEFTDIETGTVWSILGRGVSGELSGEELTLLPHRNEFWFAFQAFAPAAEVWDG
jgi:hypothetical protein